MWYIYNICDTYTTDDTYVIHIYIIWYVCIYYIYTWFHGPHLIARASSDLPCRRLPSPWVTPPWLWLKNCNGGTQRIGPFLHLDLESRTIQLWCGWCESSVVQTTNDPKSYQSSPQSSSHHPIKFWREIVLNHWSIIDKLL